MTDKKCKKFCNLSRFWNTVAEHRHHFTSIMDHTGKKSFIIFQAGLWRIRIDSIQIRI
jgi:hypothetical protein